MDSGRPAIPLEEISVSDEERNLLIRQAYEAADFPKPRDDKGQEKELSPQEMGKMLYTAIEVTDNDLRQLAHQRALVTKTYLLQAGKIDPKRLFVLEPKMDAKPDSRVQTSRVQFSLK